MCCCIGQPSELYDKIQSESEDTDMTDKLLCGAIKHLRTHRAKPNPQIVLSLITLVKQSPQLYTTDTVTGVSFTHRLRHYKSMFFPNTVLSSAGTFVAQYPHTPLLENQ